MLDSGKMSQFGRPSQIYDQPANPNVARFLNCYNVFAGSIEGNAFRTAHGSFPLSQRVASAEPAYAVRYDRLKPDGGEAGLPAAYVASEYLGSSIGRFLLFLYGPFIVLGILSFQKGPEGGPQFPIEEWSLFWYRHIRGSRRPRVSRHCQSASRSYAR